MLIRIPQVLSAQQVNDCRKALETADWSDGRATAGYLSSRVKDNAQVPEGHPVARRLGDMILDALDKNQLFISAALPLEGRAAAVQPLRRRSGLWRPHRRRDPAGLRHAAPGADRPLGDAVSLRPLGLRRRRTRRAGPSGREPHQVPRRRHGALSRNERAPGGAGVARACGWRRSSGSRAWSARTPSATCCSSSTLDCSSLGRDVPDHGAVVQLMGVYHNLLRLWSDT